MRNATLLLVFGLVTLAGCSDSSGAELRAIAGAAIVDVVMGDRDADAIFIYYDALGGPAFGRAPDVVLDNNVNKPRTIDIVNNRLFVGNLDNDDVVIWNDFLGLVDGQAPDVILTSSINKPSDLQVLNNDLYVTSQDNNEVLIFRDVTTLTTGDAPDVILSGIADPIGLAVTGTQLFVPTGFGDEVHIFNNPGGLTTGATADVILDLDPTDTTNIEARRAFVLSNTLYITTAFEDKVWAFRPANAITAGQAPAFVLGGPSTLQGVLAVTEVGGRLFVGSRDSDHFSIVGFNNPATLVTGNSPSVKLFESRVEELDSAAGTLWAISDSADFVFGFLNPGTLQNSSFPDIAFYDPRMQSPKALRAVVR